MTTGFQDNRAICCKLINIAKIIVKYAKYVTYEVVRTAEQLLPYSVPTDILSE